MTVWLTKEEKDQLIAIVTNRFNSGFDTSADDILKTKMELDALETTTRAAETAAKIVTKACIGHFARL